MFDNDKLKKYLVFIIIIVFGLTFVSLILETRVNFAYLTVKILNILGYNSVNNIFLINSHSIEINNFCSGFYSISLFLLLILSPITKIPKKRKILVSIFGSLLIFLLNLIRILFIFIGALFIQNIEFLHIFGWFFIGFFIFLIWILETSKI